MKNILHQTQQISFVLFAMVILVGCTIIQPQRLGRSNVHSPANVMRVDQEGNTHVDEQALNETLAQLPIQALTQAEQDGLIFMREEEKLAYDVYITLAEKWDLQIFTNISQSEATHMQAVKIQLDRYRLPDPSAGKNVGEFTNPRLQDLYNQLLVTGEKSLADALTVGATIEDLDIADLQKQIDKTQKPDIQLVYENLTRGSRNHLRAFVSTLQRQTGESYQPQYVDQSTFDAILASPIERGRDK